MKYKRRKWPPLWIFKFLCPHQTLIHLIDRKTGKEVETKFYTGSMITYHHVNAYEEDDHLVFDIIAYKDNKLYDMFYLSELKENPEKAGENYSKPSYKRFVLPLTSDKVGARGHTWWLSSCPHFDLLKCGFSGHRGWRGLGEAPKHKSHCCEGERRQTVVSARGVLRR